MPRSQLTISQLVARFAFAPLDLRSGNADDPRHIAFVLAGEDELDEDGRSLEGALVLGIGVRGISEASALWERLAGLDAAALVLRPPLAEALAIVERRLDGPQLLSLGQSMSWVRFATLLTAQIDRDSASAAHDFDLDLYEIANSISALAGGPTTIEDMSSRILAFSSDQAEADDHRKSSILERRVSRARNEELTRLGVFEALYASDEPIFVRSSEPEVRPRIAIRVKSGAEVLGSIWVVTEEQPAPELARNLVDASRAVSLAILQARLAEQSLRQESVKHVARLIQGGLPAVEVARELGIAGASAFVLAITCADEEGSDAGGVALRGLTGFIRSVSPSSAAAAIGSTLYAVIPLQDAHSVPFAPSDRTAGRFAEDLLLQFPKSNLLIGTGDPVIDVTQLQESRRQADAAVAVLVSRGAVHAATAWSSVQTEALLIELNDTMIGRQEELTDPLRLLLLADEHERFEMTATASSYLEHFGDIKSAARSLQVHPNTFRYRLRRLRSLTGVDLEDSGTRFALMLQLRLLALSKPSRAPS